MLLKTNDLQNHLVVARCTNVAPHAQSPLNFPHSEREAKDSLAFLNSPNMDVTVTGSQCARRRAAITNQLQQFCTRAE
jgi:hypothetical protein